MKILSRFILLIITLIFMFVSLLLALYSFGMAGVNSIPNLIQSYYNEWTIGLLFIIAFAAGAWVLYPFFSRGDNRSSTLINETELGKVDITLDALQNLVQGVVIQQEGIEDVESRLTSDESGIYITLKGKVDPGIVIPEMTDDLQKIVKSYIEDTTGVTVIEVKVLVEDIYENKKLQVE